MAPVVAQKSYSKNPKIFCYGTLHVSEGFLKEPQNYLVYMRKNL